MIGLFEVMFFDPNERATQVSSHRTIAKNAEHAIAKARKTLDGKTKHWQIESVALIGWSEE